MAHNLEIREGVASFVETNKGAGAWHGLGERVDVEGDKGINVIEALERSKANFNVELQPIITLTPDMVTRINNGESIGADELNRQIITTSKATMRTDYNETLGIVSKDYGVVQNKRLFEVLSLIATGKDMNKEELPIVETAGVLGDGKRVFVSMKFPEPIRIGGTKDDIIDMYLIAQNDHTGGGMFSITVSPVRPVCSNTLMLADAQAVSRISFRHTRYVNDRINMIDKENAEMAYRTLGLYELYKKYFEEEIEKLRCIRLTEKQCEMIFAETLFTEDTFKIYKENDFNVNADGISTRAKNVLWSAMDALDNGVGQDNRDLAGTGLYAINGLTTYFQNSMNWSNGDKKFLSITEGKCYNNLHTAHKLIKQYA